MSFSEQRTHSHKKYKLVSFGYLILSGLMLIGFMINYITKGAYSSILYSFPLIIVTFLIGIYYSKKGHWMEEKD